MLEFLAISIGAVVGTNLRYWMSRSAVRLLGPVFPYGTLTINLPGSFVLGFFLMWTTERATVDPRWRLLVAVGFCGGYTTFSSYPYETIAFFQQAQGGRWPRILWRTICWLVSYFFRQTLAPAPCLQTTSSPQNQVLFSPPTRRQGSSPARAMPSSAIPV